MSWPTAAVLIALIVVIGIVITDLYGDTSKKNKDEE